MISASGARGLACLCLLFRVTYVSLEIRSCEDGGFVVYAAYNRTSNRTSVELQTTYTLSLARLEGYELTSSYPWVNVSKMDVERVFATAQRGFISELVAKFPLNDTISVSYTFLDATFMLVITVDSSYALSVSASVEATKGFNESFIKPYAGGRNVTEFLKSRSAVLSRWREICRRTLVFDVADNVSLAFLYYSDRSTFECSVRSMIPVKYYLYFTCTGTNVSVGVARTMDDGTVYGNLMIRKNPRCEVAAANCTVSSPYRWSKTLKTEVPPVTEKLSGAGVNATVSVVAVLLVLGLLAVVYLRYRSFLGPVRETVGQLRERMGYGRPGERCTCLDSVSTGE